ncbi:Ohr family peroxiredoxin [Massilia soli]|uniref:Ohr family peroxiredoxin n=1 Tax=Massilia soli TaxID=2792854 RepID=A0ABS7SUN4_9BURK|nr:Ohr family peroxiredoxin [Massilia soli]MBZ2209640.1 Ohr family peroxiredoxin [Massilia soli]
MNNLDKVLYTAQTHITGGRDGAARSSDGRLHVSLNHFSSAREGTNPEQLLAAGWGACYLSALGLVGRHSGVALSPEAAVDVEIDLGVHGEADYRLQARFNVALPGIDRAVARQMAATAHTMCPYSKALHGNIDVATTVSS